MRDLTAWKSDRLVVALLAAIVRALHTEPDDELVELLQAADDLWKGRG